MSLFHIQIMAVAGAPEHQTCKGLQVLRTHLALQCFISALRLSVIVYSLSSLYLFL